MTAPEIALISDRLAGAVVADDGQNFAGIEIEIGMIEGGDAAIALDQAAGGEDGFAVVISLLPF